MKPYCDRPLCTRQFTHEHAPESPDTALSGPESDETDVSSRHTPRNGRNDESGAGESVHKLGQDLVERARAMRSCRECFGSGTCIDCQADGGECDHCGSTGRCPKCSPDTSAPPESEDKGGALPEVEAGTSDLSEYGPAWKVVASRLAEAEAEVERLRAARVEFINHLRAKGWSFGRISELTGISRQRVSQLAG